MTHRAPPPGVVLRRLRDDDSFAELTTFLHRAYAPLAARGLRFTATHQDVDATRRRCTSGECWMAEAGTAIDGGDARRIVGTITWYVPWAESTCEYYRNPAVAHFGQFAVESALQGCGLGRAMIDHVAGRAAASGYTELACDTAAPAADLIAMYERWGFRRVGSVTWDTVNYSSVLLSKTLGPVA